MLIKATSTKETLINELNLIVHLISFLIIELPFKKLEKTLKYVIFSWTIKLCGNGALLYKLKFDNDIEEKEEKKTDNLEEEDESNKFKANVKIDYNI